MMLHFHHGSSQFTSELNSMFGVEEVDRWNPIRISAIQSRVQILPHAISGLFQP
jgi:hypothetical protein